MSVPTIVTEKEEIKKKIELLYDRVYGFSKNDWSDIKSKRHEFVVYIQNYCRLITNEKKFRFILYKPIERFSFIIGLVMFLFGLLIQQIDLGLVGLIVFISLAYFFSIHKSIQLNTLNKRYNARLNGAELDLYGMKIVNKFGNYHWLIYMFFPPLKPNIIVCLMPLVS